MCALLSGMKLALLFLLAGLLVSSGWGQNAERFHNLKNSPSSTDLDSHQDDLWDAPPEDARAEEQRRPPRAEPRGGGNETRSLKASEAAAAHLERAAGPEGTEPTETTPIERSAAQRQMRGERRRRKRRRDKQHARRELAPNLVNVGGRNRGKKERESAAQAALARSMRRRCRRNRLRASTRLRLERLREEQKWPDLTGLILKNLLERSRERLLSENPLNLSCTRFNEENGPAKLLDPTNSSTSSSSQVSQLTTEPRIPEPPQPTPPHPRDQPGEIEREFSRHVEREFEESAAKGRATDTEDDLEEDSRESEELPRFDEHLVPTTREPEELPKAGPFDAERMLGYSRTDEDLPILDLENEVLQRTLQDYKAYMNSSPRAAAKMKEAAPTEEHRANEEEDEDAEEEAEEEDEEAHEEDEGLDGEEPRGDLTCINGTFVPAPYVQHAVIKYVKSSRPGHEYLEADYECEAGFTLAGPGNASRLMCRERRWLGRLPSCVFRTDYVAGACFECEQLCRIVEGRATCLCHEGYRLEGRNCVDIDECLENGGRGPCADTCRNLAGGFSCSCEGRPGARLGPDGRGCVGEEPEDKGPCGQDNAGCSHTCLASMGRVFCLCPDGFMLGDDWKTCQDVDECAVPELQTEVCRYGCINTPGSYRCAPAPATQHPFLEADRRRGPQCQAGYDEGATGNCLDINECAVNNGGCSEICENTEGSYFCACEGDERILSADRKTCIVAEKRLENIDQETARRFWLPTNRVSCTPLNPVGRGYLMCSDRPPGQVRTEEEEERRPIRPGTKCRLKCPYGYELHGEYELTCRADGTWDGPKHGECLRYSKPRLDCPKDVVAELPPGRDEAFVTYEQPSTDLDWFRYVRSKPSWGTRLEANLKKGEHEITFYARHPVSKKQATCTLNITVEEGQAPKVKGCPSDIEITGRNGSAITWVEPVFTDNVKVTRITSNESPGRTFSVGGHKVEYEASDEAGWTTKCIFTVVLRPLSE